MARLKVSRGDLFASSSDEDEEKDAPATPTPARGGEAPGQSVASATTWKAPDLATFSSSANTGGAEYGGGVGTYSFAALTPVAASSAADCGLRPPRIDDGRALQLRGADASGNAVGAPDLHAFQVRQLEQRNAVLEERVRELEGRVAVASAGEQRQAAANVQASAVAARTVQELTTKLADSQAHSASLQAKVAELDVEVSVLLEQQQAAAEDREQEQAASAGRESELASANALLSQELDRRLAQIEDLNLEVELALEENDAAELEREKRRDEAHKERMARQAAAAEQVEEADKAATAEREWLREENASLSAKNAQLAQDNTLLNEAVEELSSLFARFVQALPADDGAAG